MARATKKKAAGSKAAKKPDAAAAANAHLLAAGALLPPKAKAPKDARVDKVKARVYTHPALGERPVVRLVPEALSRGEDVKMDFLGFGEPKVSAALGQSRHRALGFPGWALINDPDRARFALEVMKDFRREARRARSKPGHAKDGFEAIAARLSRSVPHFLPSFYEEAGRAFLEEGNTTYAAQCFGKAREAEKVHALDVNEDERRQSFIEFALAGAVTIKALQGYAKDLAEGHDAGVAYHQFRELALRRTLGGLPPWSAMSRDIRKLAKAAGLDEKVEARTLLAEVLPAQAIARAPEKFWEGNAATITELLADEDDGAAVRDRLLSLAPDPPGYDAFFAPKWIAILDKAGALSQWEGERGLETAKAPAGDDGAKRATCAGWLARMLDLTLRGWRRRVAPDALFALLRRFAPHLVAAKVPLRTWGKSSTELELDFTDLALELGVPVADPTPGVTVDLDDWAQGAKQGEDDDDSGDGAATYAEHPRDPTLAAADPRFAAIIAKGVSHAAGDQPFESVATGKEALRELRRAWLDKLVQPANEALPGLAQALRRIDSQTSVHTFGEFPEMLPKLQKITLEGRLAATLQGGVIGELCWPALEKAWPAFAKDLPQDGKITLGGAFPYLVLTDERRCWVIGPNASARGKATMGVVYEHDLQLPKGADLRQLQFIPAAAGGRGEVGELFVGFRTKDWTERGYFSSAPRKKRDMNLKGWGGPTIGGRQIVLPEGEGSAAVHLGDGALFLDAEKAPSGEGRVLCDGESFWTTAYRDGETRMVELDPRSGQQGRASYPRFVEQFIADNKELDVGRADLYPLPAGVEGSPLGAKDGLTGERARTVKVERRGRDHWDDEYQAERAAADREGAEFERVDGVRFVGTLGASADDDDDDGGSLPNWLLDMPGAKKPRPVVMGYADYDDVEFTASLWSEDGKYVVSLADGETVGRTYDRAAPQTLPPHWWHVYQPRDEAGSSALRKITKKTAAALLAVGLEDVSEDVDDDEEFAKLALKKTVAAVKKALPAITDAKLRLAVAGVVAAAARLERRREHLWRMRDPENPEAMLASGGGEEEEDVADKISSQLKMVCSTGWNTSGFLTQLRSTAAFFTDGKVRPVPECGVEWPGLIGNIGALAYFAPTPALDKGKREALLKILEAWAQTPFAEPGGEVRAGSCKLKRSKIPFKLQTDDYNDWGLGEHDGHRYLVLDIDSDEDEQSGVRVVEWIPDGAKPKLLPSAKIDEDARTVETGSGWGTRERIEALVALVRERGEREFEREHAEALAEHSGLSYAEACMVLTGYPNFDNWSKNFLPKPLREAMGLKVAEAGAARDALRELPKDKRRAIYEAAMPEDVELLYDPLAGGDDSFIARLGAAVKAAVGDRFKVDAELATLLNKEIGFVDRKFSDVVTLLTQPDEAKELTRDGEWRLADWGMVELTDDDLDEDDFFRGETAQVVASAMLALHTALPAGHGLVAKLDKVHKLATKRLGSAKLMLDGPLISTSNKKKAVALAQSVGGKTYKPHDTSRKKELYGRDAGDIIALPDEYDAEVHTAVRPAKVKDWDKLRKLDEGYSDNCAAAEALRSPALATIAARAAKPVIDEGAYEANPLASAADTVTAVRKKIDLSEDAAVLYLQLLALPRPTDKHVMLYNDWKRARLTKAAKELVGRELCVEAKRARAGRSRFLPGGWENLSRPNLPVETWKLPMYGVTRRKNGSLVIPMDYVMPQLPLHELFASAWKRVTSGDAPRYEEV